MHPLREKTAKIRTSEDIWGHLHGAADGQPPVGHDADALALTFAQPVVPIEAPPEEPEGYAIFAGLSGIGGGWMR